MLRAFDHLQVHRPVDDQHVGDAHTAALSVTGARGPRPQEAAGYAQRGNMSRKKTPTDAFLRSYEDVDEEESESPFFSSKKASHEKKLHVEGPAVSIARKPEDDLIRFVSEFFSDDRCQLLFLVARAAHL